MKRYLNITLVRHAESLANVYTATHNNTNPTDLTYMDSKLSDLGKYQIESVRKKIIKIPLIVILLNL
jgi:broad specificity phosphatase PhoE